MKLENRQIVELVSVLAVIFSLLFVAYEIRQSNKIAIAENAIEIRNNYNALSETVLNNFELAELIYNSRDPNTVYEGYEYELMESYVFRVIDSWRPILTAHEQGLIDSVTYNALFDDIDYYINTNPALHSIFRTVVESYPSHENNPIDSYILQKLDELE